MSDSNDKVFDLGRDNTITEYKGEGKKPVQKTERSYPSVYIWKAPVELARALARAGNKGVEVKATIVPVSASETTVLKDNSNKCIGPCAADVKKEPTPREEANVEFEIHTMELVGTTEVEDEDSDESTADAEELIIKAGKKLGIIKDEE